MSHKRQKRKLGRCALIISGAAIFILFVCGVISYFFIPEGYYMDTDELLPTITIQEKLIRENEYSRPGKRLWRVKGIVVHYTANPGSDAIDNRNYFNNLPSINENREQKIYASSHFVVGLKGEIVQCIPLNEIAYASNDRNSDTIAIECCHPKKNGKFTKATYKALVELVAYLCIHYDLDSEDVIRHYDVTGKMCPLYFVENEEEWNEFHKDINKKIAELE